MSSQKPYLVRAIFDWLVDNGHTPHLLVDATIEGVQVPHEFINEGKIVLNIDPGAVRNYHADNDWISFSARFSGKAMELFIPIIAIRSIYGKENNQGMFFPDDEVSPEPTTPAKQATSRKTKTKHPGLKLVK
jgi:stringent starvation protein B